MEILVETIKLATALVLLAAAVVNNLEILSKADRRDDLSEE